MVGFEPQVLTQTFWCGGDFDLEERLARRKEQSGKERNREEKRRTVEKTRKVRKEEEKKKRDKIKKI